VPGNPSARHTAEPAPATFELTPKVAAALRRYRIASFVVGVGLLILVAAMVLKYAWDSDWAVAVWGPIHGLLYAIYVLLVFDLSYRAGWKLTNLLKILLAGVVPVLSFVAEHWVNRTMLAGQRL
jgi:integral membrane protein